MANSSRIDLHNVLATYCNNCYFQPPETIKLSYPCIIYSNDMTDSETANNRNYINHTEWKLLVIDRDPDSEIPKNLLLELPMISITDAYSSDGLYNTVLKHYTKL